MAAGQGAIRIGGLPRRDPVNLVPALGTLGTFIGLVRAAPQLARLLRRKEAFGVSVDTAGTSAMVGFGWVTYGLLTHQPYVSLATGASAVTFTLIALAALLYGRPMREIRITPIWLAVLALGAVLAGKNGLGLILPVSVLVANVPQVWVACREDNLSDLSLGTWLLSMSDGLVWEVYALIRHDVPIMVFGLLQLATSGLIVALKLGRGTARRKSNGTSADVQPNAVIQR
jgi:uncharacterized protein with PQ loop repeat